MTSSSFRYAHFADVHLGAFRDATLRALNLEAFKKALDACVSERVGFVVISGDLFHTALPDLGVVDEAVKKMREACDSGIRFYLVYGSHDYSPAEAGIIDVLASAGIMKKVFSDNFVTDGKTGAKIIGISARKRGLESEEFKALDAATLESEAGYKIFVFHSAIEEFKPDFLKGVEGIPLNAFPKGFDYYAGGHVHARFERDEPGVGRIVFPGPLFAADYRDLEALGKGGKNGFYLVEAENEGGKAVTKTSFKEISVAEVAVIEYDAGGKSALQANNGLQEMVSETECGGKIILLKVSGELREGKPGEIDFAKLKGLLSGALSIYVNRNALTAREQETARAVGESPAEIEEKIFAENAARYETENDLLKKKSPRIAKELLKALGRERGEGETRNDYEKGATRAAERILEVSG